MKPRICIGLMILSAMCVQAGPLTDSSAAIEAALACSGLGQFVQSPEKREKHVSAILETVTDSILPSLNGEKTQAVWKIQLDSIKLMDYGACEETRRFEIYLDANSGAFLMAKTVKDIDSTYYTPQPEWSYMEMELSTSFREVVGYPVIAHPTTMLNAWFKASPSRPCFAEEAISYLVMIKQKDKEPYPCWIVIGRSTRAIDLGYSESKQNTVHKEPVRVPRENWVTLVRADTGELSVAFNID